MKVSLSNTFARYSVFLPKMWNFVTEFARNQIKIKSSVDKAFWDETKSFLQYNDALVEKREEKHRWTSFFNHHEDDRHHSRTMSQGAKPWLQLTFISP